MWWVSWGGVMFSEVKLKKKYESYIEMCSEEDIDPTKVMDFDQYCKMYIEILQMERQDQ